MNRSSNVPFVKPTLEQLEDRIQPSFLLGGNAVGILEAPIGKAVQDMQSAQGLLSSDLSALKSATTVGSAETYLGFCCADYQRISSDHAFIAALVPAETNFINAVAMSEFTESGDIIDLAILKIPFLTNIFHPLDSLTNDLTQASSIWNNGQLSGTLGTDVNASPHDLNNLLTTTSPIVTAEIPPALT